MPNRKWVKSIRSWLNRMQELPDLPDLPGNPPFWAPASRFEGLLYGLRDFINTPKLERAITKWGLNDYDVYHFEQGIDPFRDGRWIRTLSGKGKGIVSFYHGTDLRNRGVINAAYEVSALNMTSEIDLLHRMPGMKYLYLPIDTDKLKPAPHLQNGTIRICHAARNRRLKGSDTIERVVLGLKSKYPIEWVMIENLPHARALEIKAGCDICIDQITDLGGWGYGASSVEALALGLPTLTLINPKVEAFLGDHPFVSVTTETLECELVSLIEDEALRHDLSQRGRDWVIQRHGLNAVMEQLYGYYSEAGLI